MFISLLLLSIFFTVCISFGFLFLYRLNKINSLVYLIPCSVSFGGSAFIFLCHLLSFLFGPKGASIYSLIVLTALSIILFFTAPTKKYKNNLIAEISKKQLILIFTSSLTISTCTFFAGYKYGMFDEVWHIPLGMSIYHNNIYPPKDFLRPDYKLIYHYGGDLLAGALTYICKTDILTSFELISGLFSGICFFSLFCLAWILTKNYKISFISSFCAFFGTGFFWICTILNYFKNQSQPNFIKYFFINGIHGPITNSASEASFTSTSSIGYPVLILCFLLFYFLITLKNDPKTKIFNIASLIISLFALSLFAGWLSLTFIISISAYWLIKLFKKENILSLSINYLSIIGIFLLLNKLFGNQMYSAENFLGRANIFNIALKNQPFIITIWNNTEAINSLVTEISCFSFKFLSAFGLSLILLPFAIIYLAKNKNDFSFLLFLSAALTIPLPLFFDFKLNPVDFNRLFNFGNIMLILLITTGIGFLFPNFFRLKSFIFLYTFSFCFSSLVGFTLGTIFSPQIYLHPKFTELAFKKLKHIKSPDKFIKTIVEINKDAIIAKNVKREKYKDEIKFFNKNGKSNDVAISSLPGIPLYSGVYTLIPSMNYGLRDQIYSGFDNIYPTIISTLDPHLISELNVKWVAYDEVSKSNLSRNAQKILNNMNLFKLAYSNYIMPEPDKKVLYEIFHVEDLSSHLAKERQKTGWILVNREGFPLEIVKKLYNNISLFPSEKKALVHLKRLHLLYPQLKQEKITAQPIIISITEQQLKENMLSINLKLKN